MKKFFSILIFYFFAQQSFSQNLFVADTFTYTINLDLSKNLYLKTVPVDLLKGYCRGEWNAYYPNREMNQCLFDDFLQRFNAYQLNIPVNSNFCFEDYCNSGNYQDLYSQFARKLKYKEILYFDQQHSVIKRQVLWFQVFYSKTEGDSWQHYDGPIFWLMEIKKSQTGVFVKNKNIRSESWTLEKEFNNPAFITNENKQKDDKKKIQKMMQTEEN